LAEWLPLGTDQPLLAPSWPKPHRGDTRPS
jgi:hypothetical protein